MLWILVLSCDTLYTHTPPIPTPSSSVYLSQRTGTLAADYWCPVWTGRARPPRSTWGSAPHPHTALTTHTPPISTPSSSVYLGQRTGTPAADYWCPVWTGRGRPPRSTWGSAPHPHTALTTPSSSVYLGQRTGTPAADCWCPVWTGRGRPPRSTWGSAPHPHTTLTTPSSSAPHPHTALTTPSSSVYLGQRTGTPAADYWCPVWTGRGRPPRSTWGSAPHPHTALTTPSSSVYLGQRTGTPAADCWCPVWTGRGRPPRSTWGSAADTTPGPGRRWRKTWSRWTCTAGACNGNSIVFNLFLCSSVQSSRAGFRHVEAPGQPSAVELWRPTLP